MNLHFDLEVASRYHGTSQKVKAWTEDWMARQGFCPQCGEARLTPYRNNRPVADFHCARCAAVYELKSQSRPFGSKVVDGAYRTMVERLASSTNPSLYLLHYDRIGHAVVDLLVIPKHYFTAGVVEQRKPLAANARRAGWVGCTISLKAIPASGRIPLITGCRVVPKHEVLDRWRRTAFLRDTGDVRERSWLVSVMRCVEALGKREFTLDDVYRFEPALKAVYPDNRHVRAKIRQQLQRLRDERHLRFKGRGVYSLVDQP